VRRLLLAFVVVGVASGLASAAACNQAGSVVGAGPDADATSQGSDEGTGEAADETGDELTIGDACGAPPYVNVGIVVVGLTLGDPDGSPLQGAQFTSPLCPGIAQYSDDAGNINGVVSQNVPFYGRLQLPSYVPELAPELIFDASSTGHKIDMIPTLFESILLPGFDLSTHTVIVIAVQKTPDDDGGACSAYDGITFTVPGHPEAQITYFSNDTIPAVVPDAGATTARGIAAVTGLAPGQLVSLAGTKPGCNVTFQYDITTGRTPLETGFVSLMPAYVTP
jgi:hypothetical protein